MEYAYYGWNDQPYVDFMFDVLKYLEPRREEAKTIICGQNEEVNEVLFFDFGTYAVGFEMNTIPTWAMKFKESNVINAYACTFNMRSEWIYKTITVCSGFSIRRVNWKSLLKTHTKIVDELIDQVKLIYFKFIEKPLRDR